MRVRGRRQPTGLLGIRIGPTGISAESVGQFRETTGSGCGGEAPAHPHDWGREERLPVTCWCEDEVVEMPASEIRAGRTGSCGKPGCWKP